MLGAAVWAQIPSHEEQFILELSKKKFDWLIGKNYDSLSILLDDKIQYIHSNGWIQNKGEILGDLRTGKLVYKGVTIKESTARLYATTALATGLGTFEGVTDGKPFLMDLRYTEVYIKSNNHWRLVSRHSNKMP